MNVTVLVPEGSNPPIAVYSTTYTEYLVYMTVLSSNHVLCVQKLRTNLLPDKFSSM